MDIHYSHELIATISSSIKSAGLWVNENLYDVFVQYGAKQEDDKQGTIFVRVQLVNEYGVMLDTYEGNLKLIYNFQDSDHPERWAKGRFDRETSMEIARHRSYFNPCEVVAEVVDHGKIFLPHPNIVDKYGEPITARTAK